MFVSQAMKLKYNCKRDFKVSHYGTFSFVKFNFNTLLRVSIVSHFSVKLRGCCRLYLKYNHILNALSFFIAKK